jgi:hypothetical protein
LEEIVSITVKDIAWAAGFLEGEGHFRVHQGKIEMGATQKNIEPLKRLVALFGGRIYGGSRFTPTNKLTFINRWVLYGKNAAPVMMTIFSLMSETRKEKIRKALLIWKDNKIPEKDRTHCKHGHSFNRKNTWIDPKTKRRGCRECNRIRSQNRRDKIC